MDKETSDTFNTFDTLVMEVFLVLITVGTGVINGVLQMASESLGIREHIQMNCTSCSSETPGKRVKSGRV